MAIKAIINNTEKEIEQIKNSDEQDIDYVYSRIGDTEVEGEPPISIKSIGGELANYRIYGNTVDGESVGDRTGNLFDGIFLQGYWAYADGVWTQVNTWIATKKIPCKSSTTYTFSFNRVSRWYGFAWFDFSGNYISYNAEQNYSNIQYRSFSAVSPPNAAYMAIDVAGYPDTVNTIFPNDITDFMLVEGSTALPYEPYGYKVPVTVEGINILPMSTTPISTDVDDFHCEYDGTGTITLTTDKDNAVLSSFNIPLSEDFIVPVSIGQGGDGCVQFNNSISASLNSNTDHICVSFYYNSTFIDSWGLTTINRRHSTYSSMGGKTINRVVIDIKGTGFSTNRKIVIRPALVLNTTEQVPFEPYHAPVTTPIYLPEPIKKVGDEAEYIDYGEQKLHRVRKNLLKNTAKDREIDVTFTVNSDGSVTCNGTASAKVSSDRIPLSLPAGSYYLNGTPSGGSLSTYHMFVWYYNDEFELIWYNDIGDGVSFTIDNSYDVNVGIEIISGYTCNNLTFYPMIRKADIEDDTYEPYIENTELDVTLPALSTIKGTNTLSVNTSIQPSNIYIKDSFDYKKVFTATRAIEDELPLNYKSIEDNNSTLKNYRIYGNTVDGESVGDRTGNLFDMKKFAELCVPRYASVTFADNTLSFTSTAVDAYVNYVCGKGDTVINGYRPSCIDVLPSTTYTVSMSSVPKCYISWINSSFKAVSAYTRIPNNQSSYTFTTPEDCTKLLFRFGKEVTNIGDTFTISNIMLNAGSTPLPYEPYGYKVPVTVEGKNLCNNSWEQKMISADTGVANSNASTVCCDFIPVKPNVTYSCSRTVRNNYNNLRCYGANKDYLGTGIACANNGNPLRQLESFGTFMITDARVSYIRFNDISNSLDTKYMLVEGEYTAETMPLYEPYHAPVTTPIYLPEPIKMVGDEAEYIDYGEQKQHRVRKNLLQNTATSRTTYGVTLTVNSDGSVTCNGTATATIVCSIFEKELGPNTYILSGCPENGAHNERYKMQMNPGDGWYADIGNGLEFEIQNTSTIKVRLVIYPSYTCDNLTFYPMIRKADIEDDTYEPYIENTDLDVTLPALSTIMGTNVLSVRTAVQPSGVYIKGKIKEIN